MAGRLLTAVVSIALITSCTTASSGTDTTVATGPGRLVIVDGAGDVVLIDPDGSDREPITDSDSGTSRFTQPVWSPDSSKLAWGQFTEAKGFAVAIRDLKSGETTTLPTENLPFYTFWSPDGSHLGVLHNGSTGVVFRMVDVASGSNEIRDEDAPFYFTWSPEGDRVVTHAGVDRVESLGVDGSRERLEPTGPHYLAPQWTDRGVFHVAEDRLVVDDGDERIPIVEVRGFANFVANPAGDMVAIQTTGTGSGIEVSVRAAASVTSDDLVIIDVDTGELTTVAEGPAAGFFWAPDGETLLVFEIGDSDLTPLVWANGETTEFASHRPPITMIRDTFPFFPQYAQSIGFWSPDSTSFVFAGAVEGAEGIWVQELTSERPVRVSSGVWAAWSGPRT
jgi:TolB protein